ncbi:MAG: response regulator [Parasphingorhabdus sp.]|nr:response regulator [Parasphingorhabdus sp.]
MSNRPRILLVDDEASLRQPLAEYLTRQGFDVKQAADAATARTMINSTRFDIALLDIMMPGEDGLSLSRHIQGDSQVPIIFLTAMGEETERIIGLEMGADDYVTKPFSPRELVARIKVVLRRAGTDRRVRTPEGAAYQFAGWTLKTVERQLIDATGVHVPLSGGEYQLLLTLLTRPAQVLNRDHLLDLTQGREAGVFDRSIDNQISRLRRKIEVDPKNPEIVKTVWGGGYVLSVPVTGI